MACHVQLRRREGYFVQLATTNNAFYRPAGAVFSKDILAFREMTRSFTGSALSPEAHAYTRCDRRYLSRLRSFVLFQPELRAAQ